MTQSMNGVSFYSAGINDSDNLTVNNISCNNVSSNNISSNGIITNTINTTALTASGNIIFTTNPISANTPTLPSHLINKDYVDILNTIQDGRLGIIEGVSSSQTTSITALQNADTTINTNVTNLTARVTNTENINTSQASSISTLQNADTTINTNVTNLTTRVTNTENINTSQASSISALQNADTTINTNITNLTTRVTNTENINISQASSISALQNADTTIDTNVTNLTTRVTNTENINISQASSISDLQGKTVQINYVTPIPAIGPMTQITSSLNLLPYTSATILKAYTLSCNAVTCLGQIVAGGVGIVTSQLQITNSGTVITGLLIGVSTSVVGTNTVTFGTAFVGAIPKVLISSNNGANMTSRNNSGFTYSCSVANISIDWIAIQN